MPEGAKFACALVNGVRGNGAGEICAFGPRARRKRKNMQIAERQGGDEIHGGGVICVAFAGEANDDVGADGGVRQRAADEFDAAGIMRGAIPAMHSTKNPIRSRLQRQMEMRRDAWFGSDEVDEILSDVDGLNGAKAKAGKLGFVEDFADERVERNAQGEVSAVAAEIDSAEDDFLCAGLHEAMDFAKDGGRGEAAAASADERNHAVGAAMIASVLNFESGASARGGENIVKFIGAQIVR